MKHETRPESNTRNLLKALTVNQIVEHYPGANKIQIFVRKGEVRTIKGLDCCFYTVFPFVVRVDGNIEQHIDFKISIKPKWKRIMDIKECDFWVLSIDASQKLLFNGENEEDPIEYYKSQFSFITNGAVIDSLFKAYMNLKGCEEFDELI